MISKFLANLDRLFLKIFITFFLSMSIVLGSASVVFADDGDTDPTFGEGGIVSTPFYNANSGVTEMALQNDGKIVTCGTTLHNENYDFHLIRFNSDGTLDSSFGNDGMVMTDIDGLANVCDAMAIQSDGKIVVAGSTYDPVVSDPVITIVRYNSDGSLDPSFGTAGIVSHDIGEDMFDLFSLVLSENKIILGIDIFMGSENFVLVQFNQDGSIDTAFGVDGKASPAIPNLISVTSMGLQIDGKILVSGSIQTGAYLHISLFRLDSNGSLDTGFGTDGVATADHGSINDSSSDLAIQEDGKIVVVGNSNAGPAGDFAVVRFSANGSFDTDFGSSGFALADYDANYDRATAVTITDDDKILVTGYTDVGDQEDIAVARFTNAGLLDDSFDNDGKAIYDFENGYGRPFGILAQGNNILIGGSWSSHSQWNLERITKGVLIRFSDEGVVDPGFGSNGIVNFHGIADVQINDVIIQPDDKIIVVGQTSGYFFDDIFLARYESDGSLDLSFGEDGVVVTPINPRDDRAFAVTLQSDGKILICGSTHDEEYYVNELIVLRYTVDGSLDLTFGGDGIPTSYFDGYNTSGLDIGLQSDNKIVVVGQITSGMEGVIVVSYFENGTRYRSNVINDFTPSYAFGESLVIDDNDNIIITGYGNYGDDEDILLVRLNSDLELDSSFGSSGMTITDLNGMDDRGRALLMQDDARLIVAGSTETVEGSDFVLVGYTLSGLLDTSFGNNGVVVTSVGSGEDEAWDMAFMDDGRIVVVGQSHNGHQNEIVIARFLANGAPDGSFGENGVKKTTIESGAVGKAVAVQPDSNLIVAGYYSDGLHDNLALIRFTQSELKYINYIPLFER